jgi:hypothetical protein
MMKNVLVYSILFCSFFSFAQKSEIKKLNGKWKWIETSGGFGGMIQSPKTEGYSMTIAFAKKNSFKEWKNKDCLHTYRYDLLKGKSVREGEEVYLIYFRDQKTKSEKALPVSYGFIGKDTLILSENVHDGFSRTYVRIKK